MATNIKRIDTWVAGIEDHPGGLAAKLSELKQAGVCLEMVIARRAPDKAGSGVVFVTPIKGAKQVRLASAAGFARTKSLQTVRLEGPDRPGEGARITQALAAGGLNLRGFSAAAIGKRYVAFIALDSAADAVKAVKVLRRL